MDSIKTIKYDGKVYNIDGLPTPSGKDKILISNESNNWEEIEKDELGQPTWIGTKAEWDALEVKPKEGTVVQITDDFVNEKTSEINDSITSKDKTWSSEKLASKIESVINDANYFVTFPNGNYIAIGSNEVNGPNDGSGIHMYMTSLFNGCFFQICGSHGTGKLFVRNGTIGNISKSAWREI